MIPLGHLIDYDQYASEGIRESARYLLWHRLSAYDITSISTYILASFGGSQLIHGLGQASTFEESTHSVPGCR